MVAARQEVTRRDDIDAAAEHPGHQRVVDQARQVVHAIRRQVQQGVDIVGCRQPDGFSAGQHTGVAADFVGTEGMDAHDVQVVAVEQDAQRPLADIARGPLHDLPHAQR